MNKKSMCAVAALVLAVRMRTTKVSQGNAEAARGGDVGGAVLLAALTAGTLGALSAGRTLGWGASATVLLAAGAICALAAFIIVERRSPVPTVDLSLFRVGPFAVANILNALTNGAAFVIWLLVPYLAVNVLGHPARVAGFVLAVAPMAMAVVAPRVGRLSDRIGAAAIASAGIAICAVGLLGLSRPAATTSTAFLVAVLAVIGLGLGTFQVPNMSFVMGSVGSERQGMAGGLTQMMRTVGIVASVSLASSVFDRRYHALRPLGGKAGDLADNAAWTEAFRYVVLLATLVAVGSAVLSVAGRGVRLNATARSR